MKDRDLLCVKSVDNQLGQNLLEKIHSSIHNVLVAMDPDHSVVSNKTNTCHCGGGKFHMHGCFLSASRPSDLIFISPIKHSNPTLQIELCGLKLNDIPLVQNCKSSLSSSCYQAHRRLKENGSKVPQSGAQ